MNLRGQQGYAMVTLLVALSVMAILMTVAMPAWRTMVMREKEEELVFRGQQYARAISLFQRKAGPGVLPPNVDVLVSQRFLRKKYIDPITGKDFDFLTATQAAQGQGSPNQGRGTPPPQGSVIGSSQSSGVGGAAGGIVGVASKSKDASIRIYNGRTHYNEWAFVYVAQTQAPGAGANGPAGQGRGGLNQGTNPPFGGVGGVGGGRDGRGRGGPAGRGDGRGAGGQGRGGPGGSTFTPFGGNQPTQGGTTQPARPPRD